MLDLDISLVCVSALVGILMLILTRLYFKPVGQVIRERDAKIKQDTDQIDSMTRDIAEKTGKIEAVLKGAQKDSRKIKETLIKKGEDVREKIVDEAREKAREMFQEKMGRLDNELRKAEKQLEQEIGGFSEKINKIFFGD